MVIALIAVGGAAGAVLRYVIDSQVSQRLASAFPWGTFVVNMTGSLILGILFAWTVERGVLPSQVRAPLMIGFVGAYTTFSTLMLESWRLVEDGATALAAANIVGSCILGLIAVFAGLVIGRAIA